MTGRGVAKLAGVRVEGQEDGGRHPGLRNVPRQAPGDLGRRRVLVGERPERVAQLPHQYRGRDSASGHVSDGEVEDPVGPANRVVPVAADLETHAAGVVAPGELEALDDRELLGQQAPLERDGDVVLPLVPPSPGQRSGRVVGVGADERLVRIVERSLRGDEQRDRADRADRSPPGGEGEDRPRSRRAGLPPSTEVVARALASVRCTGAADSKASVAQLARRQCSRRSSGARRRARTSRSASVCRRLPRARRSPSPRGTRSTSAEPSAADTSAAADASPSDWASSSQRRTCSRSASISLRERTIAQPTIPSTTNAAAAIEASSRIRLRRAEANTAERGRSITVVQPGAFEFANATARPASRRDRAFRQAPRRPVSASRAAPSSSGRAKLVRVSCWPARSMTTSPSNPRSVVRGFVAGRSQLAAPRQARR